MNALRSVLKVEWIYAQPAPQQSSAPLEQPLESEFVLPSQDILQHMYHLAMMGDIPAIEGIIEELVEQNSQYSNLANELKQLTATFQTGKIRKLLKSFITTESRQ